jgi:hypothetical protein
MKHPFATETDKERVFKRLPMVKANLIQDLKAIGLKEKWVRHLIWLMRRNGEIYQCQGVIKKT